jgi:hypothetical protein
MQLLQQRRVLLVLHHPALLELGGDLCSDFGRNARLLRQPLPLLLLPLGFGSLGQPLLLGQTLCASERACAMAAGGTRGSGAARARGTRRVGGALAYRLPPS